VSPRHPQLLPTAVQRNLAAALVSTCLVPGLHVGIPARSFNASQTWCCTLLKACGLRGGTLYYCYRALDQDALGLLHHICPLLHAYLLHVALSQGRICAAGYPHPMHPSQYSHVLYVVQLSPSCIRWSYMPAEQAWKMPSTAPARFDKSVATVSMSTSDSG
jgi:hypothetical protein